MDDQNPFAAPAELGIDALREAEEQSPVASRGERDFAMLVDVAAFGAFYALGYRLLNLSGIQAGGWKALLTFGLTLIFAFIYYYLTEFKTGKSPGKFLARITVLSRDGQRPTCRQFVYRTFARLIPFDSLSAADVRRDLIYLRDKLSRTVVVSDRRWKGRRTWLGE